MKFEEILKELEERTNFSKEELLFKIKKKQEQLHGLISEEGAALLVARELGIRIIEEKDRRLEIKNLIAGLRDVRIVGRIFKISPVREFEVNGKKGKVVNLYVGDETGYFRLSLWDEQVRFVEEGKVKVGDVVEISKGISRENIFGEVEVQLKKFGSLKVVEGLEFPSAEELEERFFGNEYVCINLKNAKVGRVKVRGTIVHVYKRKILHEACPFCSVLIKEGICQTHGDVKPDYCWIISGILDDGEAILRFVCFREVAKKLIGLEEISATDIYEVTRKKLVGKEVWMKGRIRMNKRFGEPELLVDEVEDLNYLEESKKLVGSLEHGEKV